MTIKTLHITNSYHPASGGIRTFYHALLDGANRHRRPVRLIVPAAENSVQDIGDYGRIYHVAAPRVPVLDSRYRWMLPHTYAWRYDSPLRRIFASEQPDLVEVCDKFWLLYLSGVLRRGWIAGVPVPVIVGLSCERLDENMRTYISETNFAQFVCERYMRSCYVPRFDFHIAASHYIGAEIRHLLPQRLAGRLHVCPMGVDYDAFSRRHDLDSGSVRARLLVQLGCTDGSRGRTSKQIGLLLYAGRLSKEKNLLLLPAVLAVLVAASTQIDYFLVIAGDGPFAPDLRTALEAAVPGRSLFLGHCDRTNLAALFHATDVFLHPNPREPFGIAPLEAMAAGLPLVAPTSGGVLTYANRENSWLAESSPTSFSEAVRNIHADSTLTQRKIRNARMTAAQFAWPQVISNYFHLYDQFHERFVRERSLDPSIASAPAPHRGAGQAVSA
jgi:glycosyltransferase involved in cell wall biosynthesis